MRLTHAHAEIEAITHAASALIGAALRPWPAIAPRLGGRSPAPAGLASCAQRDSGRVEAARPVP